MTFRTIKLENVCLKIGSGATPRGGKDAYQESGEYSLVRSQNVLDFTFSNDGLAFINEEQASKLKNVALQERDILLNITGDSVARVCQIPKEFLPARVNQHVAIIRPNPNILNPEYLKFYLLNPEFKEYMLMLSSSGATRNAITKGMIEEFEIEAPDLPTQTAIAEILSSLDDKIELNNQINQNLEALAQAIFKQWFVDFEFPFDFAQGKPDEKGVPYKSAGGEMVDSQLGEIPKGWEVQSLDDVSKLNAGGDKPKEVSSVHTEKFNIPIYSNGISNDGLYGYTTKAKILEESVTVSARGTIGFVCLRNQPFYPIVRLITLSPKKEKLSAKYLFMWLRNQSISGNGTTQQQLTVPDFKTTKVVVPDYEIVKLFTNILDSFYDTVNTGKKENQELSSLRDTILPKLISGELVVIEAMEQIS